MEWIDLKIKDKFKMPVTQPGCCQINWDDTSLVPADATGFGMASSGEGVVFISLQISQ